MDFDVIIYVLIGIVWIIVSVVQANQKAKKKKELRSQRSTQPAQSQTQTLTSSSNTSSQTTDASNERIENWLAELMGVETAPAKQEIKVEQDVSMSLVEEKKLQEQLHVEEKEERIQSVTLQDTLVNESNFVSQQYDDHILSDFDLRKAVIYSEILKRPYN